MSNCCNTVKINSDPNMKKHVSLNFNTINIITE